MSIFNRPIYFCNECKKVVNELDDLLFIEEHSYRGFCSTECIEDFYFPLIKQFEIFESTLRTKLNLGDEQSLYDFSENHVEACLKYPDEIYEIKNELNDRFLVFIKNEKRFSIVVVSTIYQNEPSFILLSTLSESKKFVSEFRKGNALSLQEWGIMNNVEDFESEALDHLNFNEQNHLDDGIDQSQEVEEEDLAFLQLLESKKSKLLGEVLVIRQDSDIPIEEFVGYDSCFTETLESPDEVFEWKDEEGDIRFNYIKSFPLNNDSFEVYYYIVICIKNKAENLTEVNAYPILGMPTKDLNLCQEFRKGKRISSPVQN